MPYVLHDFLPVDVDLHLAPRPILLGLAIGVWVALLFAMRPLVALRRVSPLQALRREPDADALRRARWDPLRIALSLAIAASVLALGLSRANTPRRGVGFTLAIAGAIGILWLSAAGLSWAARRLIRPSWPFPLRQGIASLYRPGNQTRAVVLALGFGVFLMGTLYQVQYNILRSLDLRLGEARANVVFFDVQENQQAGIDSVIHAAREELIDETPIVAMRVASINGKSATAIADEIDKNRRLRDSARVAAGRGGRGARGAARRGRARSSRAVGVSARVPLDLSRLTHRVRAARVGQVVRLSGRKREHARPGVARLGRRRRDGRQAARHDHLERAGRAHSDDRDEHALHPVADVRAELLRGVRPEVARRRAETVRDSRPRVFADRHRAPPARRGRHAIRASPAST